MKAARFKTPEYRAWTMMKTRCYNANHPKYPSYGGRGIQVCMRWLGSFAAFLSDVGTRPSAKHSLDRKDNDGDYEPGNVRWATAKEQANNRRPRRAVTFRGETMGLGEWAARLGVSASTLARRLDTGWPKARALTKQGRVWGQTLTHGGRTMTINAWSKVLGVHAETIRFRMKRGLPLEAVLSPGRLR